MGKRGFYFHPEKVAHQSNIANEQKIELIKANRRSHNDIYKPPFLIPRIYDGIKLESYSIPEVQPSPKMMPEVLPIPKGNCWIQTSKNIQQQFQYSIEMSTFIEKRSSNLKDINNNPKEKLDTLSQDGPMYSYIQLFCRRCYSYGCENHQKYHNICSADKQQILEQQNPCSSECYLNKSNVESENTVISELEESLDDSVIITDEIIKIPHSKSYKKEKERLHINKSLSNVSKTVVANEYFKKGVTSVWNDDEKKLAKELLRTFPANYCAISSVLQSKMCWQVMLFAKDVPYWYENLPTLELKRNAKKSKKRKHNFEVSLTEEKLEDKYRPCNHPNKQCCPENIECWCAQLDYPCEKYCSCASDCINKISGCNCKSDCISKSNCKCHNMNRECDPDRCHKLENQNDYICKNNALQLNSCAYVLIRESKISGWGAFSRDTIKKGSLIEEYTGEIISVEESENRGDFYKDKKVSYLFELNESENIDAYFFGNNIRFANHSRDCNSFAQVMKVQGEHRVGIYAMRDIEPEEEILFDYGEHFLFIHPEMIETIM